jgi:Domain of unknown function (DUF4440)
MPIMTDTAARHALPNSPTSAHDELSKALLAADELTLRRLVADDCQIIGPKGFHILKEEWIGPHVGNVYELQSLDVLESTYAVHDQSAVIVDLQQSACVFRGEQIDGLFRVLSVWRREPDSWQLAALQYTAVANAAR